MRLFSATVIATALTLAACTPELDTATSSAPADSIAATVVDPLIGKRLVSGDTTFIINANGTMSGEVNGEPVVGVYEADAENSLILNSLNHLTTPEVSTIQGAIGKSFLAPHERCQTRQNNSDRKRRTRRTSCCK